MIKSFEAKTQKVGSWKLETVEVKAKSMMKALEYLQDLGYNEPESIKLMATYAIPKRPE